MNLHGVFSQLFDRALAERPKTPAVSFHPSDALGWEAFKRMEHKDGVQGGVSFTRGDPKAPLAGFFLDSPSQGTACAALARNSGQARAEARERRTRCGTRWGSTPISVARAASVTTVPSAVQMAVGDASVLSRTAPFVVSTFKKAARDWDAALAPSADPFARINAKLERAANSPLVTQRLEGCADGAPAKEAEDAEARRMRAMFKFELTPDSCRLQSPALQVLGRFYQTICGALELHFISRPSSSSFAFINRAATPLSASADAQDAGAGASRYIFAAAERAASPPLHREITSPFSVNFSETISTRDEMSNFCSSASSTSRSFAYRPVRPEQIRAAIQHARPHTLATSQRQLQAPFSSQMPSGTTKLKDPFRKVVVGRAMTSPLLQVGHFASQFDCFAKPPPFH